LRPDTPDQCFLIADTASMYASSLRSFFHRNSRAGKIEIATSKLELLESMDEATHDLLIIEPWCAHAGYAGTDLEFLASFRARYPDQAMVVFTGESSPGVLRRIFNIGRIGITSKFDELSEVLNICDSVVNGEHGIISRQISRMMYGAY
jgi:two-component system, NarL family, captular synthesis response regulator RcsB